MSRPFGTKRMNGRTVHEPLRSDARRSTIGGVDLAMHRTTSDAVPLRFELALPPWVGPFLDARAQTVVDVDEQMDLVVALAREHVDRGTGGPFAAAVFETGSGRLLSVGVNLVVPSNACVAHAEIVALALAGRHLGSFHLGLGTRTALVTSTEPCAMCLGALAWSGVTRLVFGACDEDARAIGFDEGDKPAGWVAALEGRGIEVVGGRRRDEARAALERYAELGGLVYNGAPAGD
jgi:tRNA(Arg) A34 adenosine deaminase TadA